MTARFAHRAHLRLALLTAVAILCAGPRAHADADLEAAKQFLAGRPELAAVAGKVATNVAPGVYRIDVAGAATGVFLVKQGSAWVGAMPLDLGKAGLGSLLPPPVAGDARIKSAFVVVGSSAGSLDPKALGGDLKSAVAAFGAPVAYQPGTNLFVQLEIGRTGALGQLAAAGLLPSGAVWITGTIGPGLVESLTGGPNADPAGVDFAFTLAVASMVPAPFAAIASPKLTLGDARFTIARTRGAVTIAGEQSRTTLALSRRTFVFPRTTFTFTARGSAYDIAVSGSTQDKQAWKNAFGLSGVDVTAVTLDGTLSAASSSTGSSSITGFGIGLGARVVVNTRTYTGTFALDIKNNRLEQLALKLGGDLDLGFLPGGKGFTLKQMTVAITPATGQAALAGELAWQGLTGQAAVVLSKTPMLFVKLTKLDLLALVGGGKRPAGFTLPPLDALVAVGFGSKAGDVTNLPSAAQALIDEIAGTTGGKVTVGDGLTVLTRVDGSAIGAKQFGITGPIVLAGSVDPVARRFRLAASLAKAPPIPGLPKGFGIEAPELFVAVDSKTGAPVASFGLGMRLRVPVDKQQTLLVKGSMAASTAGTFAFTGAIENDWNNPLGLDGITLAAPVVVTIGVGADTSVDLGIQAGLKLAKQTYSPMAMCVNLQPAAPTPVPKKLAVRFKGSELGPSAQLQLMKALVKSVTNGPLKNASVDPTTSKLLKQVGNGVDQLDKLGAAILPAFSFKDVDVALTTPGVTCDLPAIKGMGVALKGRASFMGKSLGMLDSAIDLEGGLRIKSKIADIAFLDLVKLTNASIDLAAPMPGAAPPPAKGDNPVADKLAARIANREFRLELLKRGISIPKVNVNFKPGKPGKPPRFRRHDPKDVEAKKQELEAEKQALEREIPRLKKRLERAKMLDLGHFYLKGRATVLGASADMRVAIDGSGASFDFTAGLFGLGNLKLRAATKGDDGLLEANDFEVALAVESEAHKKLYQALSAALRASAAARKNAAATVDKDTEKAIKAAEAEFERLDDQIGKDFRKAQKALDSAKSKLRRAERDLDDAKDDCEDALGPISALCDTVDVAKDAVKAAKRSLSSAKDAVKAIEKGAQYARLKTAQATVASLKASKSLVDAGLAGWAAVDRIAQLVANGAFDLVAIEKIELEASLKQLRGTLGITLTIAGEEIEHELEIDLGARVLDLGKLAEKIADELTEQALEEGSQVWNELRKKK